MARAASEPPVIAGLRAERLLGSGGFSDVFLYTQELPRRQVAVKVLSADEVTAGARAAFVAEANLMAQLSAHPFIVTIHNAAVADDGRPYFVMEYCPGPSLSQQYRYRRFGIADVLRTGIRVASAVATAHQSGILHRDIKPANVLENAYGWPALADFGISAVLGADERADAGGLQGLSIPWSPPEMFSDMPVADVRSDVYSLAATIRTLLAGHSPFEIPGESNGTVDLIARIERGSLAPLARDDAPASLLAALQRGMAVRPADRFASVVDLARSLQRVEIELGYSPTTLDVPGVGSAARRAEATDAPDADPTRIRPIATLSPSPGDGGSRYAGLGPRRDARRTEEGAGGDGSAPPAGRRSRRAERAGASGRRRVTIVVAAAAVLAAAAVVLAIAFGGAPEPTATPGPGGTPVSVSGVPSPELEGVDISEDGTRVTFTWTNPDPKDGDSFVWARSDGADEEKHPTTGTSAVVDRDADGDRVCITVSLIRRDGKMSTEPLEMCAS